MKKTSATFSLLFAGIILLPAGSSIADKTPKRNRKAEDTRSEYLKNRSDTLPAAGDVCKGHIVTKEGAWCWFADPRALHYENESGTINSTYIGYIDVHGNIKATQYNFITGKSNEVLIRSYFQPDDHDTPSFLVLPDERIMIFYSRHTDEACFYYRISTKAGDITSLGAEMKIVTKYNTTYPSPFILSADTKHFYLCWRGIRWHPTIARYTIPDAQDKVSLDWGPYQMIQSTAARPYCKYYSNGIDKIYLAYTTGHPDNEYPNYTWFNYIDINTLQLKDIKGTVLSTIANGPHNINQTTYPDLHPAAVVDSPSDQRDWIWQTSLAMDGMPVIAMVQISRDKTIHNYYFAKWTGTTWRKTFLACGGGHFHQSPGLELCYSSGMTIDDSSPDIVYCSVPVSGTSGKVYEIIKYNVDQNGKVITAEKVTANSHLNNIRPFVVANSDSSPLKLVWMHGNYYDWIVSSAHPEGFSTEICSDFAFPAESINLTNGLISAKDLNSNSGPFSVSLTPCFNEEAYGGVIFKMGNLVYGLDSTTLKPYVTIGDTTYNSTNLLGTSDIWQTENRATGGKWWPPTKVKYFYLAITYGDKVLKVYRDGLIDQVIEVSNLIPEDVVQGEFKGLIKDSRIYNRVLNQGEIKKIIGTESDKCIR